MARPKKWRRVEFIPESTYFTPCVSRTCAHSDEIPETKLKIEELEAIRLKDIENLTQEECAERMHISRQTFQNVLDEARRKIAIALVEGNAISIGGGHYTKNVCEIKCLSCGETYQVPFEKFEDRCIICGSEQVVCNRKRLCHKFCK
jgi:predicted DNA-binding protein (UPF0251 family)